MEEMEEDEGDDLRLPNDINNIAFPTEPEIRESTQEAADTGVESGEESALSSVPSDDEGRDIFVANGEGVLALDTDPKRIQRSEYWPARIDSYNVPSRRGRVGTYNVTYVDFSKATLTRKQFYTVEDVPHFGECKVSFLNCLLVNNF